MPIPPIPAGYHTATPHLILDNASAGIDFYKRAFNAVELMRLDMPGGRVAHAEIKIGNSPIMLADEYPDMGMRGPHANTATSFYIMLYVDNVDALFQQAISAGATEVRPVKDEFYGDRCGMVKDPFGHLWTISTHVEDVAPEEINRRFAAMMPPSV